MFVKLSQQQVQSKIDFIDHYLKLNNASDGSLVDANANVSSRNVATLNAEINKDINLQVNRGYVYRKLIELFGKTVADDYVGQIEEHLIYKHDETNGVTPYTYGAQESVMVEQSGKSLLMSLEDLYSSCNEQEFLEDEENGVWVKYPNDLFVLDRTGRVKITRLVKKSRRRKLVLVKTKFGENMIVTDNHPMIVEEDHSKTVQAIDVAGKQQYRVGTLRGEGKRVDVIDAAALGCVASVAQVYDDFIITVDSKRQESCRRFFKLDEDFGYFVGFFIAEGWFSKTKIGPDYSENTGLVIKQKGDAILREINERLYRSTGICGFISQMRDSRDFYTLYVKSRVLCDLFMNEFCLGECAQNKSLPRGLFCYPDSFIAGLVAGLIDGDGTVTCAGQVSVRLSSRKIISQLSYVLPYLGYTASMGYQDLDYQDHKLIKSSFPVFGIMSQVWSNSVKLPSHKLAGVRVVEKYRRYETDAWVDVDNVLEITNEHFLAQNRYIYDITTTSNTFVLNNLWVHNCAAVSMYPFLLNGLRDLTGESKAPKHLESFCGSFVNLMFALSSQFAGACMHWSQDLILRDKGVLRGMRAKDFVSRHDLSRSFRNYQGEWEYADVDGVDVWENGKFVAVKRVYRRAYRGKIFKIRTVTGKIAKVSGDHVFRVKYKGRDIEVKASDLRELDTVYNTLVTDFPIDKSGQEYRDGQFAGIIAGDGSITDIKQVRVAVNTSQQFLIDFLDGYCQEKFGKPGEQYEDKRTEKYVTYYVGPTNVCKEVRSIFVGGVDCHTKNIEVEGKSLDWLLGFLDGILVTDGGYNHSFSLTLSNRPLIDSVVRILEKIGINIDVRDVPVSGNRKPEFGVIIPIRVSKYLSLMNQKKAQSKSYSDYAKDNTKEIFYYGRNCFFQASAMTKNGYMRLTNNKQAKSGETCNYDCIESIQEVENDDEYVYEIETESHWYSCGGILTHNCATAEFFLCFDKFARQDFGDDYLATHTKKIENSLQHVVYALNQPAAARGFQAVFWNVSIFDGNFFGGLFEHFIFPDGSKPNWESLKKLQNFFLKWFNHERTKAVLTFPVVTVAMLTDGEKPIDVEFADNIAHEMSEGNSFFIYTSDSVDSLSSCCFRGDQMTLTKGSNGVNWMSFKDIYDAKWEGTKRNFTVFHNGSWAKGKPVRIPIGNRRLFEVTTANDKKIVVTSDHMNPTTRGDVATKDLKEGDYLLFNCRPLDGFPEKDLGLTYDQGVLIGAYLGDGSMYETKKGHMSVSFSLNQQKYDRLLVHLQAASAQFGSDSEVRLSQPYNNVYPVAISGRKIAESIRYWVKGSYGYEKELNLDCLLQSRDFRNGIVDGYYMTNGGNSNRIYTTSKKLCEQMEVLFSSLGIVTVVDSSDRRDEPVEIRGKQYKRNHVLYCIRWYEPGNKRSMKDVFVVRNNSVYFKIEKIKEVPVSDAYVYCFEMKNEQEPYFTLPSGIITHNCRLRNSIDTNEFSYTLGAVGVMTGSVSVITLNMNRFVQDMHKQWARLGQRGDFYTILETELRAQVEKIHRYHAAYRKILEEFDASGMLSAYRAGFISLDKQYSTIGVNGMVEAAEFLGMEISPNEKYMGFVSRLLKVINSTNKEGMKKYGFKINTEFVPAENLGVKNAKWDKKDGYAVARECYNSYFYIVEDDKINALDKFILHGRDMIEFLDGGSALHLNLEENLTKAQWLRLIKVACKTGCNYFTYNVLITICEDCEKIDKRTLHECPSCGSKNISHATRIIGYLKKIRHFSEARRVEASKRIYHESAVVEQL